MNFDVVFYQICGGDPDDFRRFLRRELRWRGEVEMADEKLFKSADDYRTCVDRGLEIMNDPINALPPTPEDGENMRALYAIFTTAAMDLDPKAHLQEDFPIKMTTVRMALLAAYNLGRQQVMRIRNAIDGSGLNQYAHTIRVVFDKMAVVYKEDSSSGDLDEAAMGILAAVDADAFAEVLSTAQQVDEES